ncbi:unnamed protein product [Parascedosporium putredinis]|uniref:Endoplasmic reticulum protein n=1 Tax=Parascedosporium putredinis TaxID=1442378 RepID=A0A9P1H5I4_9PEZI|nr:unnamed protein product [Parascedosporium putredinis]CAI7996461.1 unnamed protein product [Parascedosporium putredinis]
MGWKGRQTDQASQVNHLTLILCTVRYAFSWLRFNYYGGMAKFSYRTSFIAAALTYGIVVYKTFKARTKSGARPPPRLVLSATRMFNISVSFAHPRPKSLGLALISVPPVPVGHASLLRLLDLPCGYLHPREPNSYDSAPKVVSAPTSSPNGKPQYAPNPLSDKIGAFVRTYYDDSMAVVSSLEILLWVRILLSAITFQKGSWILIAIYTVFLRARFAQSTHVQNSFQQEPPAARQVWDGVKGGVRQFYQATDINKYVNGGATAPKKAS